MQKKQSRLVCRYTPRLSLGGHSHNDRESRLKQLPVRSPHPPGAAKITG